MCYGNNCCNPIHLLSVKMRWRKRLMRGHFGRAKSAQHLQYLLNYSAFNQRDPVSRNIRIRTRGRQVGWWMGGVDFGSKISNSESSIKLKSSTFQPAVSKPMLTLVKMKPSRPHGIELKKVLQIPSNLPWGNASLMWGWQSGGVDWNAGQKARLYYELLRIVASIWSYLLQMTSRCAFNLSVPTHYALTLNNKERNG